MVVIQSFRRAQEAEYRHGNRKGCLKGTRIAVLDEIELWTRDPKRPPVYWLNGLAGTGKSAIAQTIAERMFADGRLGGSFFCSRDSADRGNLQLIFPTLAVQLARKYPEFRSSLVPLVRSDPECATESLYNQMRRMIVGPLKESGITTVIVIDALDECKDEEPESAILSVIGQFASEIPGVKFFLTGRPEPHILQGFGLPEMVKARDVFVLHKVGSGEIGGDMQRFFRHWFADIARRRRGLDDWPTTHQLDRLCERAAGLFVYAMATVKFIDDDSPRDRLDLLLQSPESSAREGRTKLKMNTTLDSLYTSILHQAFSHKDPEDDSRVRSVLGAVVLAANPLSPSVIATLLGFDTEAVFSPLSSIHSLLILQEDVDAPVLPFHKSFPDFITDLTRCTNERFHVSPSNHHQELLVECLNLMCRWLEENMCGLPDGVKNDEVDDLEEKAYLCIDESLKYACESWHKHLVNEHMARAPEVTSALHQFLETKFLCWLEVLSVLGSVREAVDALGAAAMLLEVCRVPRLTRFPNLPRPIQESPTLNLVIDCFQFVTGFFEVIRTSAPHIYHSALPLSPQTSIVRELYKPHARPLMRIVHGIPASYPSITAEGATSLVWAVKWSPCSKFIAVTRHWGRGTAIEILDAATLERLTILKIRRGQTRWLIFSPDSRLLTSLGDSRKEFISWDLRTDVQVSAISPDPVWKSPVGDFSLTYSGCGTMVGALFLSTEDSIISIYNVRSGTHIHSHQVGRALGEVWTHGECIRYATFASGSITIWESGFASRHEPTQVESLSTPGNFHPSKPLIHPTLSLLAFINRRAVLVWDCRESQFLLDSEDLKNPIGMSFSLDGRLFACGTIGGEVYLWKESPTGYILHRKFQSSYESPKNHISPDGRSIVGWGDSGVQVWRTTDPATSLSSISTQTSLRTGIHKVEFSPGELFVAIAQLQDNVITVLDLESGNPWLIIDTSVKVHGLGVGRSAIVVASEGKIVTWDLPTANSALNARVNIDDSARTITFTQPPSKSAHWNPIISISPDLHRMAIVYYAGAKWIDFNLRLYCVSTGQCIAHVSTEWGEMTWLTLGGRDVWCGNDDMVAGGWSIVEDSESDAARLEPIGVTVNLPGRLPRKPGGCEVTDDGWVLSSSGKRLLWLPPYSRSDKTNRAWSGRFLALLRSKIPEPLLLELPAE
jgi:WD40 repeat protein